MIQIIGLMIGAYIFTRMLELASQKGVQGIVQFFAILTIIVDVFCIFGLLITGQTSG